MQYILIALLASESLIADLIFAGALFQIFAAFFVKHYNYSTMSSHSRPFFIQKPLFSAKQDILSVPFYSRFPWIILSTLRRWEKSAAIQELLSFLRMGSKHKRLLNFILVSKEFSNVDDAKYLFCFALNASWNLLSLKL